MNRVHRESKLVSCWYTEELTRFHWCIRWTDTAKDIATLEESFSDTPCVQHMIVRRTQFISFSAVCSSFYQACSIEQQAGCKVTIPGAQESALEEKEDELADKLKQSTFDAICLIIMICHYLCFALKVIKWPLPPLSLSSLFLSFLFSPFPVWMN